MAQCVPRSIHLAIDIRRHNTVKVSPRNDRTERYTAFVYSFNVISDPGDGVGDTRVDPHGAQKRSGVGNLGIACSEKHCVPRGADKSKHNVEYATTSSKVRCETHSNSLLLA